MLRKTTAKIGYGDSMYLAAAKDIGKNNRIEEKICCSLSADHQDSIKKPMSQPFKLFLDLL